MLPRLPYQIQKNRQELVELRGVNYSDAYQDGDLRECTNLSARRWPFLSARRAREHLTEYDAPAAGGGPTAGSGPTAMTAWEKLVVVRGTDLLYDGEVVGTVTAGEKQFAVVNTRLVIWPDKVYLDLQSKTVTPMAASVTGSGAVFTANTLKLSGISGKFKAGDTVTISGSSIAANNKDVQIKSISGTTLTVADNSFTAGTSSTAVTVARHIPDLDFICESENRLWGCSNATRTIYASALGDPTNFYNYQGLSTDSYAVAVGSEGEFTGCCKLSGGVLFWKEHTLHKLLGSFPAEYAIYTYNVEGLKAGCHKSMQVINEALYYLGNGGVYVYTGGSPRRVSPGFEGLNLEDGSAGLDGERYYLSARSGQHWHLFVLDLTKSLWLREDDTECVDFARLGSDLYFLTRGGKVCRADAGVEDKDVAWNAAFAPFYETIQGRKRYSRLILRLELPKGSWARAEIKCDGGTWETVAQWTGREQDAVSVVLPIRRCDRFELRLSGKGPCAVLGISREFSVGSER